MKAKKSTTGFPLSFRYGSDYLSYLYKNNGEHLYCSTHLSTEKGSGYIHNIMYETERLGYITIERKSVSTDTITDTLFSVKLTLSGIDFLNKRRDSRFNRVTAFIIIILNLIVIALMLVK